VAEILTTYVVCAAWGYFIRVGSKLELLLNSEDESNYQPLNEFAYKNTKDNCTY